MNVLFVDPEVEAAVIAAARRIEHAAQYGYSAAEAVRAFDAARALQQQVRSGRGRLLRQSGATLW